MKKILMVGAFIIGLSPSVHAQVSTKVGDHYREFKVTAAICTGEVKNAILQVNTEIEVNKLGDPELGHGEGYYDYLVTGSVVEGDQTCKFELLLTQTDLERKSTDETLKSRADRDGVITLCSGLQLPIASVRTLLTDASMTSNLKAPGLMKSIGAVMISSSGVKEVLPPAEDNDD